MRRLVTLLAGVLLGVTACSGSSGPPPVPTADPNETSSPVGPTPLLTSTPPPVTEPDAASAAAAASASSASVAALDLPACMTGSWTAPLDREFGHLDVSGSSGGAIRSGTGFLDLRIGGDRTWTLTYRQVRLQLVAGSVAVSGPLGGSWSMAGNILDTAIGTDAVSARLTLAGVTGGAPGTVTGALRALPPDRASVTCTGSGLRFELPTSRGGGAVTFDPASAAAAPGSAGS